jgi:hypothetical protein
MYIYKKTENFVHIKNFLNNTQIEFYLNKSKKYIEHQSKVGSTVRIKNKIRKDIFFNKNDCAVLDEVVFKNNKKNLVNHFGYDIRYRESYKMGTYYGDKKGHYIPHTDNQGGMNHRKVSCVICLSKKEDYEGGVFHFVDLKKTFKFDKGDAILFRSHLLHGVKPVESGIRKVIISFLWDNDGFEQKNIPISKNRSRYMPNLNNHNLKLIKESKLNNNIKKFKENIDRKKKNYTNKIKYITTIPPDSGPGNQIISIKECLIISYFLKRKCIIPPIREHYVKSNKIYYNFNDIFKINLNKNTFIVDNINYDLLNSLNIDELYQVYSINNKLLRHEIKIKKKLNNNQLINKVFKNTNSFNELKKKNNDVLILKHLFNNVRISNCSWNGCFTCKLNKEFEKQYKYLCSKFDFSDKIKDTSKKFITNYGSNYIAIHIRLPDIFSNKSLSQLTTNKYNKIYLKNKIINVINSNKNSKIFIASNNIKYILSLGLNIKYLDENIKFYSFIDQYICCMSHKFYFINLESTRINKVHNRSTYTSFILDYRKYLLNNKLNFKLN